VLDRPDPLGDHVLNPDLVPGADGTLLRDAAVLVPVVRRAGEATVILTERSNHLPAHAGQVAFPGGKVDPHDDGPLGAALRESHEEIALLPKKVEPLGFGDPYLTNSGYRIVPVVALIADTEGLFANENEVEEIFEVPLSHLMSPGNHVRASREWAGRMRYFYTMPYQNRYIWGVTAGIIRTLFERLYR
jgi:8-oxo-dGTP pyrophosphatase MutT (NUDIX family)